MPHSEQVSIDKDWLLVKVPVRLSYAGAKSLSLGRLIIYPSSKLCYTLCDVFYTCAGTVMPEPVIQLKQYLKWMSDRNVILLM